MAQHSGSSPPPAGEHNCISPSHEEPTFTWAGVIALILTPFAYYEYGDFETYDNKIMLT